MIVVVMYLEGEKRVPTPPGYPKSVIVPSLTPTTDTVGSALLNELRARGIKPTEFEFAWLLEDSSEEVTH